MSTVCGDALTLASTNLGLTCFFGLSPRTLMVLLRSLSSHLGCRGGTRTLEGWEQVVSAQVAKKFFSSPSGGAQKAIHFPDAFWSASWLPLKFPGRVDP